MSSTIPSIIFDTDSGYDDAWSLFILLKAHSLNLIQLLAIICVTGNTNVDNCVINVCRVLEVAQQTSIPVYRGAYDHILFIENRTQDPFHGSDGFGDIFEPTDLPDMTPYHPEEHGVTAMARIIKEHPGEISLLVVGSLTNVALAMRMYPEIIELIVSLTVMGGNFLGIGNITPSAEFNAFSDPEAVDIVLRGLKRPITIVPWEVCIAPRNTITWDWRRNVLGERQHPILTLLNPVEDVIFNEYEFSAIWECADCIATVSLLAPDEIIKSFEIIPAAIELHGQQTRGQFVVDRRLDRRDREPNAKIITEINTQNYKKALYWTIFDDVKVSLDEYLRP
uniref:Putative inosine-uridine preferring nucleoside hydrolase n=2 Tax=Nyssomyia neivai TaxID=330878 RepID=A0A1L8DXX2_9DIPT